MEWKPVATNDSYGTGLNRFNRVRFDSVKTDALRLHVQLQPSFSGGILEWKLPE